MQVSKEAFWLFLIPLLVFSLGVGQADSHFKVTNKLECSKLSGDLFTNNPQPNGQPLFSKYIPNELILKFKSDIRFQLSETQTSQDFKALLQLNAKFCVKDALEFFAGRNQALLNVYKLVLSKDADMALAVEEYTKNPLVEWAEPNYVNQVFSTPNDYYYGYQWALSRIEAGFAWDIERGNRNISIAIIDTGVEWTHPDLADNVWNNTDETLNGADDDGNGYIDDVRGWDFVNTTQTVWPGEDGTIPDNDPMDFHGHGTHCAGIAGAVTNNSIGIAGICWNCNIMALRAGYKGADGQAQLENFDCAAAINYAADNGANVISMSWGSYKPSNLIRTAIDYAYQKGLVLVAAAGNDNGAWRPYPAGFDNVISVAATTSDDSRSIFSVGASNYGSWIDVAAPGGGLFSPHEIWSTMVNSTYGSMSGTSMATPLVAGIAALILSKNSNFTNEEVRSTLRTTVDPIQTGVVGRLYIGTGRVNAFKAVERNSTLIASLDSSLDDIFLKDGITVNGTVAGITASIVKTELLYGSGFYPTTWTIIAEWNYFGMGEHSISVFWNTSLLIDGVYSLLLRTFEPNNQVTEDRAVVKVDKKLRPGFPASIGDVSDSSPVLCDLDEDGEEEIIVGSGNGKLYIFKSDGTFLPGWPKELDPVPPEQLSYVGASSPAVADVDNDGHFEIIVKSGGHLHVLRSDGSYLSGWPQFLGSYHACFRGEPPWAAMDLRSSPAVGDLDNDGHVEIVTGHNDELFAFRYNGSMVDGWPVVLGDSNTVWASPTMVDLDSDGYREVIFQTSYVLADVWVLRHDGTNMTGWPKLDLYTESDCSPVLGDLDGDGSLEILTGSGPGGGGVRIFAWHSNGSLVKGWPFSVPSEWYIGRIDGLALGDVNEDEKLEVVACCAGWGPNSIWVLSNSGVPLTNWPQSTLLGHMLSSPTVGDINGDGEVEIVVGVGGMTAASDGMIYAWRSNGGAVSGWPKFTRGGVHSAPTLWDFDNDAKREVVVSCEDGMIYAWDTEASSSVPPEWPMFQHEEQHSGAYKPFGVREIAIADIKVSNSSVFQGQLLWFNVTVENRGDFPETFNTTVFCNLTIIGVQRISLLSHNSTTLVFPWNTTNVSPSNYTVTANVSILLGESNMTNNRLTDGVVTVVLDTIVPTVTEPFQLPDPGAVQPGQEVKVFVNVTDYETGVNRVILSFISFGNDNASTWTNVTMTNIGNATFAGAILGHPSGVLVEYVIIAFDNAGNFLVKDNAGRYYVYVVVPEFSAFSALTALLFITLFLVAFRKRAPSISRHIFTGKIVLRSRPEHHKN